MPQKALEELPAPPEMGGQRVCLGRSCLSVCVCVHIDERSRAQRSHKSAGREAPNSVLRIPSHCTSQEFVVGKGLAALPGPGDLPFV